MEILKHGKKYNEKLDYPHAEVKIQKCKCGCVFKYSMRDKGLRRAEGIPIDLVDFPFFDLITQCPECEEIIVLKSFLEQIKEGE